MFGSEFNLSTFNGEFFKDSETGNFLSEASLDEMKRMLNDSIETMNLTQPESNFLDAIRYLDLYLVPIISMVGLTGNLLSLIVFVCTYMRRLSSSIYLAALAVADTFFLLCLFLSWATEGLYETEGWCQTFIYVTHISTFLSVWYVVAFTCERYIVVYYPLRRQHLCTTTRAKITVCSLAAFAAVLYSFAIWTSGITYTFGNPLCGPLPEYAGTVDILNNIDTIITFILPFLAIVAMNVRIAYKVILFYRNRKLLALDTIGPSTPSSTSSPERTFQRIRRIPVSTRTRSIYTRTQVRVTKMLLTISTIFLVLNLPRHTARIYLFIASLTGEAYAPSWNYIGWQKVFEFLYYMHFAVNLFLYSVLGKNFRTALLWLCRRIKHSITEYASKYSNFCHHNAHQYLSTRREIILNDYQRGLRMTPANCAAVPDHNENNYVW